MAEATTAAATPVLAPMAAPAESNAPSQGETMTAPAPTPVPAMSPVMGGARLGRRLGQKMLEEIKNVRRKSPAPDKLATPLMAPALPVTLMNPPVLSLNASEDDRHLSVGEEHSGAVSDSDGQTAPSTRVGLLRGGCSICERSFTVFRAKHTCKICNQKICDDCSKNRIKLNRRLERKKGSRLCDPCARKYMQTGNNATPMLSPSASPMLSPLKNRVSRHNSIATLPSAMNASLNRARSLSEPPKAPLQGTPASVVAAVKASILSAVNVVAPVTAATAGDCKGVVYHTSHLRPRHVISGMAIGLLVLLRMLTGGCRAAWVDPRTDTIVAAPCGIFVRTFVALVSVRLIGTYLLALVLYDELVSSRKHEEKIRAARAAAGRRRRASSLMSESARKLAARRTDQDEDEVLEVDTGDTVEEKSGFRFDKLLTSLDACVEHSRSVDTGELQLAAFVTSCEYICEFMLVFGRATSFAASTVNGYFTTIDTNTGAWPAPSVPNAPNATWKDMSVRSIVEHEVELGVANVGGKKNPSCCRCILRLKWFVEFVEACMCYTLIENQDESCLAGASRAYEETLGVRHPWIIRKGVNSALGSIPTRSALMQALHLTRGENGTPGEEDYESLKRAQAHMKAIINELHVALKAHDLLDLK